MTMNYEKEIEELNEERRKAAERINKLMKMRDVKNNLVACQNEGHVWILTGAQSDMWDIKGVNLTCTRCHAECSQDFSAELVWTDYDIKMLKDIIEQSE